MSKRSYTFTTGILVLVGIVLLVELIRDIFKAGDFVLVIFTSLPVRINWLIVGILMLSLFN